ncbi:hypothetical protein H0H93_009111 [Arthromyces matolae]|nr:hypothetical protein H0H93_009111 [Arthromyces matolae]
MSPRVTAFIGLLILFISVLDPVCVSILNACHPMPEGSEGPVTEHKIEKVKQQEERQTGKPASAKLVLFPRVFAEGTPGRSYQTASVSVLDGYSSDLEDGEPVYTSAHDLKRSKKKPWEYLVTSSLSSGPLCTVVRGKGLAIAAGHHCLTINFGLEANVIIMTRADFEEILQGDRKGPSPLKGKSERLRSFKIPNKFVVPGSSPKERLVNIFAAFICSSHVITICDFSRIVRLGIISSPHIWSQDDLSVGSLYWNQLWKFFPDGPDCNIERDEWDSAMEAWRARVISRQALYASAIVDVMEMNTTLVFEGFGRHLANDFLHLLAIFPGTPAYVICDDDSQYRRFKNAIPPYMAQWRSPEYLKSCGGSTNSLNPFAFNTTSNRNYTSQHIHVFRRCEVLVDANLFNRYQRLGLLDPNHTIGEPYTGTITLCATERAWLPVFYYDEPLEAYSVIVAKRPDGYIDGHNRPIEDITKIGWRTGIGPSEFFESKNNKISEEAKSLVKPGRPPKNKTHLPGRPRKPLTLRTINQQLREQVRRTSHSARRLRVATRKEEERKRREEEEKEKENIPEPVPQSGSISTRLRSRK